MLASPCCMHGSLAFGCMILCKGALHKFRIVLLMLLHHTAKIIAKGGMSYVVFISYIRLKYGIV